MLSVIVACKEGRGSVDDEAEHLQLGLQTFPCGGGTGIVLLVQTPDFELLDTFTNECEYGGNNASEDLLMRCKSRVHCLDGQLNDFNGRFVDLLVLTVFVLSIESIISYLLLAKHTDIIVQNGSSHQKRAGPKLGRIHSRKAGIHAASDRRVHRRVGIFKLFKCI